MQSGIVLCEIYRISKEILNSLRTAASNATKTNSCNDKKFQNKNHATK
jgi:hypothetical protein